MILLRRLLLAALAAVAPALAIALTTQPAVVVTEQVRAELLAHAPEGVAPGKPLWLGLAIDHAPHWHTYWKNPGDSGLPTTLEWTLPPGFVAGDIEWPTPQKLPVGPLMNFGHEGRLLLPVRVKVPDGFSGATLPVRLRADWLVCKDVCIPEGGDFALEIPAQAATSTHAARFEAALAQRPQPVEAQARARVEGGALVVTAAALPEALRGRDLDFFPELPGVIDNAARTAQRWIDGTWEMRIPLSAQRSESPQRMVAVLAAPGGGAGVQIAFEVAGPWPPPGSVPLAAAPTPAPQAAPAAPPASKAAPGFVLALLLAIVGGSLLNLMPCVFPVLSLKVMGFAAHAHERRALLTGGLAYTAGVVVSFVALAALLLVLRAGGEQLGWGFQLQSPAFVTALALLFTLIGLNLAGVFEFGSVLPGNLAALRARHPIADSALTGVLAVAVASPCTAPFMGASLGVAATLPAPQALAIFAALGLGMALPYLAASAWPALAHALPRPGPWMARFKALMAFPMFATVVWLLWVLGQQVGIDGAAGVLGLLVAAAFVAWALGTPGMGRGARAGFGAVAVAVLALTLAWALPALRETPPAAAAAPSEERWQPWSAERVAELNAQGRAVFVDFTAAWCVTCQFNKRTVLGDPVVLADFELHRIALMRADWTRRDAAITAELARLGRNGVPVYAIYRPGGAAPQLLSELLSVQEVRSAIAATKVAGP
ncbi:thioredoxin family protein [Calidifontimicrobium sp. SYSU G02091]|uniref:protein-disulfide reductase DsbD family protein n=1 Tax=Calidifontimicrobium sp. SYSU G02091 TaxID=2926421 RepID=UPI001F52D801|nr:thioredoxin family protein [Calidifontimicrobium sp. SYSU G02091]MCI1190813.1 thioredoxin family protein [Calidifontimicrobium sp. SYSU G02091]